MPPAPSEERPDFAALVPSQRDFLQAVRTGRKALALVPCLADEDAAREALRMAEFGVTALAMKAPSAAMAAAAAATRLPMLSLQLVATRDDALSARAYAADAVLLDPSRPEDDQELTAASARSTRMVALSVARTPADAERAQAKGAKALVVHAATAAELVTIAAPAKRLVVIACPSTPLGDDLQTLRGLVDAVVVDVDVYGATGFERLVSELYP